MLDNKLMLRQCEFIFDEGFDSIIKVAKALELIKTMKLYEDEYSSFELYCKDKLKIDIEDLNNIMKLEKIK